jgi:hypothetical protein
MPVSNNNNTQNAIIDIRSCLRLKHGLASFNNLELYFLISKILGLGGFGDHFIQKERLYLAFSKEYYLRFLFIYTLPIVSKQQKEPETTVYYGHIDEDFEDIEIYGGVVPFEKFSADRRYLGDGLEISDLLSDTSRIIIKPVDLVEGLLGIILNTDIKNREPNPMFSLTRESQVPKFWRSELCLFANFRTQKISYSDFCDCYYLVAEPIAPFDVEFEIRGSLWHEYVLKSENDFSFIGHPVGEPKMKKIVEEFSKIDLQKLMVSGGTEEIQISKLP